MRKLLFVLLVFFTTLGYSQRSTDLDPTLYGYWLNGDGEVLIIQTNNTFTRRTASKILAAGKLDLVDGEIRVIRTDIEDEYSLGFHVRKDIFVVTKPGYPQQAWLFTKIGN
jgi:hypothetical protein